MSTEERSVNFAANNPYGSVIVGVHKEMLDSGGEGSEFFMVEGHLPHIERLMQQPYLLDAIERGVKVKILYTGEVNQEEEQKALNRIGNLLEIISLNTLPAQERERIIDEDFLRVLNQSGPEGLAAHLQKAMYYGDRPLNEKEARRTAYAFNACIQAGLKPGDRNVPDSILEEFSKG